MNPIYFILLMTITVGSQAEKKIHLQRHLVKKQW